MNPSRRSRFTCDLIRSLESLGVCLLHLVQVLGQTKVCDRFLRRVVGGLFKSILRVLHIFLSELLTFNFAKVYVPMLKREFNLLSFVLT